MPELEEQIEPEIEISSPKARNKGGRPRKDPTQAKVVDAPNPPFTKFDSNHRNPPQRTPAAWAWWNKLTDPVKGIIEAHVYRDWPVLLDPPEGEYKYIDVIIGTDPIQTDQDFIDKYGAGKYHIYLNANPAASEARRTLLTAFIDGSHDATKYPPCDKRVQNVENVSLTDPANAAYVALLKSQGKIPDEAKLTKEAEDMAATSGVMAELVKDMAQDRRELTAKLLEKSEQDKEIQPDPPPSPQEVIGEQLAIFKSLKELVPTSDPMEMMRQVVAIAQLLVQKGDSSGEIKPLMEQIDKLREESRATEREMWRSQLMEIKDQLRAVKENPQSNANINVPEGVNFESVLNKAVEKAVEKAGLGETDTSWWMEPLKQLVPVALPALGMMFRQFTTPQPVPAFPMPPAQFQAGQPMPQQQAQLPAPQPQQQAPPQQPQQANAEQLEVERVLTAISAPVIDSLSNGDEGDTFADYVREEYGAQAQRLLAKFEEQEILAALYVFPLIAPRMAQFPQDRVVKFVHEFKEYDRDKYDAKMDAKGGAA